MLAKRKSAFKKFAQKLRHAIRVANMLTTASIRNIALRTYVCHIQKNSVSFKERKYAFEPREASTALGGHFTQHEHGRLVVRKKAQVTVP